MKSWSWLLSFRFNRDEELSGGCTGLTGCWTAQQGASACQRWITSRTMGSLGLPLGKPREGSQVPFLKICPRSPGYQRERCSSFNSLKRSFFSLHLPQSFVLTSSKTCHVGQLWLSLAAVAGGQGAQEAVLVGSDADERTNKTVEK